MCNLQRRQASKPEKEKEKGGRRTSASFCDGWARFVGLAGRWWQVVAKLQVEVEEIGGGGLSVAMKFATLRLVCLSRASTFSFLPLTSHSRYFPPCFHVAGPSVHRIFEFASSQGTTTNYSYLFLCRISTRMARGEIASFVIGSFLKFLCLWRQASSE